MAAPSLHKTAQSSTAQAIASSSPEPAQSENEAGSGQLQGHGDEQLCQCSLTISTCLAAPARRNKLAEATTARRKLGEGLEEECLNVADR